MKYTLLKDADGERSIKINATNEIIAEKDNPGLYDELRKRAKANLRAKVKSNLYKSLGLTKVKGNLGGTYYE